MEGTQGVSIVTCTNRLNFRANIFENYTRQSYKFKELIVILNSNLINKNTWTQIAGEHDNVRIFQLDDRYSLGQCLNYGVTQAKHNIIAKFDDDDYYGPKYISDTVTAMIKVNADVIGKSSSFVYFKSKGILAIRNPKRDNRFVRRVEGSTLIIKREVFDIVKFSNKSLGEDIQFCKDCIKKGFRIYSHDMYNHVYIRHGINHNHTWTMSDDFYMKLCQIIGKVDDYKTYVDK